jgi:hypothetical protein
VTGEAAGPGFEPATCGDRFWRLSTALPEPEGSINGSISTAHWSICKVGLNGTDSFAGILQSPLTDSNRRPLLTMEVSERHARTRAIIRDTVSPANRPDARVRDASRGVARVVSDVSVLCPPPVDVPDNRLLETGHAATRRDDRPVPERGRARTSEHTRSGRTGAVYVPSSVASLGNCRARLAIQTSGPRCRRPACAGRRSRLCATGLCRGRTAT